MIAEINVPAVISRWIHLASVITAVGGTVFLRLVMHPAAMQTLSEDARSAFRPVVIRRWARVVHVAILFILLSGGYNFIVVLQKLTEPMPYHAIFGVKFLLALTLFFIAIAITGRSAAFEGMRRNAPKWMAVNIAIAAVIVLLSNVLKYTSSTLGG